MSAPLPASTPLPPAAPLRSFWIAGFEGADHVNSHGQPLDMVRANGHLQRLDEDYARCAALGLRSLRESLGWRLCETAPGTWDFTRARHMARCARRHGVQVLWSLMHYGTPPDVNLLDDGWIDRFAAFAAAAARALGEESDLPPVYTPVNEISFLAWAVSASRLMHPYGQRLQDGAAESTLVSGYALKRRLVRAALAAVDAIRRVDPRARFMHIDPLVHVVPPPGRPELQAQADEVASWQWQAWDMLAGRTEAGLGGSLEALDIVGVNHYHSGQWELLTEKRLRWHEHDPRRKPPALLLREAWQRYHRPVVMAETSHVGAGRVDWLHDMATQVQRARDDGVAVQGLCLYPVVDRPDWDTPGHWHRSGLFDVQPPEPGAENTPGAYHRLLNTEYAAALRWWQTRLPEPASRLPHAWGRSVSTLHQGTAMPPSSASLPPLVVFCHLRWGFVYQRPQHLLSRLSAYYRVLFVEEPIHCEGEARLDRVPQGPNLEVLVPRTPVTAPGFHDDQLSVLKPLLAEFLRQEGIEDSLVWFYTPMALPLIAALKPRAVVYDCMDELSAFKNAPKQLRQRETALMRMASVMFTGGPALFEAKRNLHPNVHCLPSSVDVNHFAPQRLQADSAEGVEAQRLQGKLPPGPRLGFYGVIDERIDLDLVAAVADAHPEWQLVMVGPVVKIDPASLPQRPNITYLGMQSYAMLPHLMAAWDLCLMPFALNESTRFISPTKTLEYMAGEKPVVSTAVRDVEVPYGDVVRIGRDPLDFIRGCEDMLALDDAQRRLLVGRMQEALRKVSWDRSARTVARCLRQALRESTADTPAALRELAGLAPAEAGEAVANSAAPITRTSASAQPPAVRHLIIGAGPTGLAAAYHLGLHDEGHDTLLVEREEHVGGGCRSVHQQGYTFDHGAHVLQTGDPDVKALAQRLLGDNLHWVAPRVVQADDPAPQHGLAPLRADRDFGYPLRGGFQALMDAFLPLLDCELALKTTLLHLSPSRRTVRLDDGRSLRFDNLISTVPLPALVQACGDEAPPELRAAARALRQGSLRCVNLGLGLAPGRGAPTDAHWIEAPAGCVFQRVFVQGNASAHNNAPGGFALSCEIAYGPDAPLPCEGAALIDRVIDDCRRIGLFGAADPVPFASQLDLPCARALPDPSQQSALLQIRQWFADHGVVLAGHHGRWHAEGGAPHAFACGRQAAELVLTLQRQRTAQPGATAAGAARQQAG